MNILKQLLKATDTECLVGVVLLDSPFDPVAAYVIDYGPDQVPLTDLLAINRIFCLDVQPLSSGKFLYCTHGSLVVRSVNLEELEEKLMADKDKLLSFEQLLPKESTPLFANTYEASPKDHYSFQEAVERNGFWMLVVKSSVDSVVIIDHATGIARQKFEGPRQEIIFRDPE